MELADEFLVLGTIVNRSKTTISTGRLIGHGISPATARCRPLGDENGYPYRHARTPDIGRWPQPIAPGPRVGPGLWHAHFLVGTTSLRAIKGFKGLLQHAFCRCIVR